MALRFSLFTNLFYGMLDSIELTNAQNIYASDHATPRELRHHCTTGLFSSTSGDCLFDEIYAALGSSTMLMPSFWACLRRFLRRRRMTLWR